ncbi:uncharacterized protein LOC100374429 [Saccoglossus kowalevskii]
MLTIQRFYVFCVCFALITVLLLLYNMQLDAGAIYLTRVEDMRNIKLHSNISESGNNNNNIWHNKQIVNSSKHHVVKLPAVNRFNGSYAAKRPVEVRYLLPIIADRGGGGNNVQFQAFRNSVGVAMATNRTIVLTPFFNMGMNIRTITKEEMHYFSETFDAQLLRQLIPVIPFQQFVDICGRSLSMVHYSRKANKMMAETIDAYTGVFNLSLPVSLGGSRETLSTVLFSSVPCLCLLDVLPNKPGHDSYYMLRQLTIENHLKRASYIRKAADDIKSHICGNQPYLALHWRDKTTEQCAIRNIFCDKSSELRMTFSVIVQNITSEMKKYNLSCIFIAHPPFSKTIVEEFSKVIHPENVFDASKISLDMVAGRKDLLQDMFKLSLLEQELCTRAEVFIGSSDSSWSLSLMTERKFNPTATSLYIQDIVPITRRLTSTFTKVKRERKYGS